MDESNKISGVKFFLFSAHLGGPNFDAFVVPFASVLIILE